MNTGCWSVGLVIGPAIGGLLSRPVQNYPNTFGNSVLLRQFPYLIPNIITASLALFSVIFLAIAFPETLPNKKASTKPLSVEMINSHTNNPMRNKISETSNAGPGISYMKLDTDSNDIDLDSSSAHGSVSINNSMHDPGETSVSLHGSPSSFGSNGYSMIDGEGDVDEDEDEEKEKEQEKESNLRASKYDHKLDLEEGEIQRDSKEKEREREDEQSISTYDLYTLDGVWQAINSQILLAFVSSTINELVPLWAVSSRGVGGLAFTSVHLGSIMTICGAGLFCCTVFLYPVMVSNFGVLSTYLTGVFLMAPVMLALSFSSSPYWGFNFNEEYTAVVIILLFVKVCDSMTFASLGTIINQTVDSSQRGLVNGLTMTLAGIGQSAGAILAAMGYAWSINNDLSFPFDSHFMFLILTGICLVNGVSFYVLSQRRERGTNGTKNKNVSNTSNVSSSCSSSNVGSSSSNSSNNDAISSNADIKHLVST